MPNFIEVAPALLVVAAAVSAFCRLIALGISLRGTEPKDRPEIIRALGEFFRHLMRRQK